MRFMSSMGSFFTALFIAILMAFVFYPRAHAATDPSMGGLTVPAADGTIAVSADGTTPPAAEPSVTDIINQTTSAFDSWKKVGAVASIVALINILINLTKIGAIGDWMTKEDLKWVRPLLSVLLAGFLALSAALVAHTPVPAAILAGVVAGLVSSGFHEFWSALQEWLARLKAPTIPPAAPGK